MKIKLLEIRDEGTRLTVMAIKPIPANPAQAAILRSAGYMNFESYVLMIDVHSCQGSYDPFQHNDPRTRRTAHLWIRDHFNELNDGDVVDVQFILGERTTPKISEIQTEPCYTNSTTV